MKEWSTANCFGFRFTFGGSRSNNCPNWPSYGSADNGPSNSAFSFCFGDSFCSNHFDGILFNFRKMENNRFCFCLLATGHIGPLMFKINKNETAH